jgi:hypothetical protein
MRPGYIRFTLRYQHFARKGYSEYHAAYAARGRKLVKAELARKRSELEASSDAIVGACKGVQRPRIAILGCPRKDYIEGYRKIFKRILGRQVDLVVFDKTIEHLSKPSKNVVKHDCAKKLPGKGFNIIYSDGLLGLLNATSQEKLVMNMNESLAASGLAVHVYLSKKEAAYRNSFGLVNHPIIIPQLKSLAKNADSKIVFKEAIPAPRPKKTHHQSKFVQEILFWLHLIIIFGFLFIGLVIPLQILVILIILWNLQLLFIDRCILTIWQEKVGGVDHDQAFMQQAYKRFTGKNLSNEWVDRLLAIIPTITLTIAVIADLAGVVRFQI